MTQATATPIRLAAPAPAPAVQQPEPAHLDADPDMPGFAELNDLFERWAYWLLTRRFYGRPSAPASTLGRLTTRTRPVNPGGPDAPCDAFMPALHLAILAQPETAIDRRVFFSYYVERAGNIKAAAADLGISRQHYYRLLLAFGRRVHAAARHIQDANATINATRSDSHD